MQKGNVFATQFHPEKSGLTGLNILKGFLERGGQINDKSARIPQKISDFDIYPKTTLVKRIVACLDVRSNDQGDLVVTKVVHIFICLFNSRIYATISELTFDVSFRDMWVVLPRSILYNCTYSWRLTPINV